MQIGVHISQETIANQIKERKGKERISTKTKQNKTKQWVPKFSFRSWILMAIQDIDDSFTPSKYFIVRPENAGVVDLFRFLRDTTSASKFIDSSDDPDDDGDHRWVIFISIILRKIIAFFGKPMEWIGYFVEFLLNLLSLNANLFGLFCNLLHGNVVMPQRGSETFISAIGHLDGRIDLYKNNSFAEQSGDGNTSFRDIGLQLQIENRALMDLSIMAAKLAYENANVVRNVVNQHWKMQFVDFYNCWNDYQKEKSTQVFILCDKPKDANLILISFRGTEPFDADDWSTDFDYSWYEIPKLGKVHMGFLEALGLGNRANTTTFKKNILSQGEILSSLNAVSRTSDPSEASASSSEKHLTPDMAEMSAYFTVRSKLKTLLDEHKNAKFMVTGHSLGGALAILFPVVLLLHQEKEVMQRLLGVHTFGQPRIGNRQLGRFVEAHLLHPNPKYIRFVYCNDLVPRLPYDNQTFLYKHVGVCLYYNRFYIERKVDEEPNRNYFGTRFLILLYWNAFWELIRSFMMGYLHGPEYEECWLSILLRLVGLVIPGISEHSPRDYVNSVRLGRERTIQMASI